MKRDVPMLSQVLHFLDFNLTARHIAYWRDKPMRERYKEVGASYGAPIFLDSGGFKLLYNAGLDLSQYGIRKDKEAEDILEFQLNLGGEILASLDYPLPPNLARDEAENRMKRSIDNATRVAEILADKPNPPFLYICCHGQSREDVRNYVIQVFERVQGLLPSFGLAVGSLVPLRGFDDSAVLSRICGVIDALSPSKRRQTPIHAFGVSGNLTPILAYLGVDSFDSTSYIQAARNLSYSDPKTQQKLKVMELDTIGCKCHVCRNTPLEEMQQAFMEAKSYQRTSTGKYKSEYYAAIALHNFEMDAKTLRDMKLAIESDHALEALVKHATNARGIQNAVGWLGEHDNQFSKRLAKRIVTLPTWTKRPHQHLGAVPITLNYTPNSFVIAPEYQPPEHKDILLTIPCAGKKPYSRSRTHTIVSTKLRDGLGERQDAIHKVTLSGLYGPVPEEFESEEAVLRYEFQLSSHDTNQIQLCANRFNDYLNRYEGHYKLTIAYATSNAYRKVFEQIQQKRSDFILLPEKPKQNRLSEFFRHVHLDVLVGVLSKEMQ